MHAPEEEFRQRLVALKEQGRDVTKVEITWDAVQRDPLMCVSVYGPDDAAIASWENPMICGVSQKLARQVIEEVIETALGPVSKGSFASQHLVYYL